ncbi:MAG: sulfur transferase domain-containing protein [Polyangiales bacterium]
MTRLSFLVVALLAACGGTTSQVQPPAAATEAPSSLGIPNERHLGPITTGGPPDRAALERAQSAGVTTVITLRLELEAGFEVERTNVEALGMRFVSVPVDGAAGVTEANARLVDEAIDASTGDILLHCGSGNRAGAMLALRAFYVQEKSLDEAMQIGLAAGLTNLQSAVRANIEAACAGDTPPAGC